MACLRFTLPSPSSGPLHRRPTYRRPRRVGTLRAPVARRAVIVGTSRPILPSAPRETPMFRKLLPALVVPALLASACAQAADDDARRGHRRHADRGPPGRPRPGAGRRHRPLRDGAPRRLEGEAAMTASGATDYDTGRGRSRWRWAGCSGPSRGPTARSSSCSPTASCTCGCRICSAAHRNRRLDLGQSRGPRPGHRRPGPRRRHRPTRRSCSRRSAAWPTSSPRRARETVRGVEHHALRGDDRPRAGAGGSPRRPARAARGLGSTSWTPTLPEVPITVWVDDDGLPRQLTMELRARVHGGPADRHDEPRAVRLRRARRHRRAVPRTTSPRSTTSSVRSPGCSASRAS